jgi:2'-5' RNA ligase
MQKFEDLGCVMLNVSLTGFVPFNDEWAYIPPGEKEPEWWGIQKSFHCTLKYGLIPQLVTEADVNEILTNLNIQYGALQPFAPRIDDFGNDQYSCVVYKFDGPFELNQIHDALSGLPHIDTHPFYQPHITLGYVLPQFASEAQALADYNLNNVGFEFTTIKITHLDSGSVTSDSQYRDWTLEQTNRKSEIMGKK